ncbi:DUF7344 domain-containing protein [Halorussus halophilus]|uniref:DUF7344 domain-containing protein n=1 Tax=Halorussus halophilus TaxID=2650975 RepID=UPI0013015CA2|nr:hypothetical protein [Halorussus halophilus]
MVGGKDRGAELDTLFTTLADEQRRILVSYLADAPTDTFSLDELVTALGRRTKGEHGTSDRRNIEIDLRHKQLPKLAEAGIVEYDVDEQVVQYRPSESSVATADRILSSVAELHAD